MILESETFVFVLQIVFDIEFGLILQRLGPMGVASFLASIDGNLWMSGPVNKPAGIPKGLRTFRHEAFEMRLGDYS